MFADFDAESSASVPLKNEEALAAPSGNSSMGMPEGLKEFAGQTEPGPVDGEYQEILSDDYTHEATFRNYSSEANAAHVSEHHSDQGTSATGEASVETNSESQSAEVASVTADEVTALREQAYAEGLAAGQSELVELKAQLEARYEELFADMQTQFKETLRNAERQAVELSFQVAQKLIGTVLESDRSYIQEVVAQALQAAAGSEVIRIRVSPQDFDFLSLTNLATTIQTKNGGDWKFESDDSIRAGCVVTTKAGEIDFNLDASWARIRDKVLRGPKS
jgi:flagellar biosynthesis/type III secretory pathway protein FliH